MEVVLVLLERLLATEAFSSFFYFLVSFPGEEVGSGMVCSGSSKNSCSLSSVVWLNGEEGMQTISLMLHGVHLFIRQRLIQLNNSSDIEIKSATKKKRYETWLLFLFLVLIFPD